jgi:two-component system, cell cycle sensor histidine kinase and response regulator CckA
VPPTRVRIDIEDTGVGVAPEIARKLFSPFVSSRPRGMGKGLGLFMAREIVRALSGELSYRTESGKGTIFSVVLPSGGARGSATRLDGRLNSGIAAARVLVVGGEPGVAGALRRMLAPAQQVVVRSHQLALEFMEQNFDVVFAELSGTSGEGLELIERVGAVDRRLARRFLLTSRPELFGDQRHKAAARGVAVLDEPFDRQALRAAVAGVLGLPLDA